VVTDFLTPIPGPRPGSTVAVVSPCSRHVFWVEHRAERGIAYLRSLGLEVKVMPHSGGGMAGEDVSPEQRAADLHAAFSDPSISVVLVAIGGDAAIDLLPYLDYDLIAAHPRVFQGYSDATVLHWALMRFAGLRTLHGPALISELGEYPTVLPYTHSALTAAWFDHTPSRLLPAAAWTDEFLDWTQQLDLTRPRQLSASEGWRTIRPGTAEGLLIGGCLETIARHLVASDAWLDLSGAILLLETSEERPQIAEIDGYLGLLGSQPGFHQIAGLAMARPYGFTPSDRDALRDVLRKHVRSIQVPVLADVDAGHTDPMLTLPLGASVRLDADNGSLELLEPPTLKPVT
jgi:muramoyltetrapeptide carboxypeptidase LdcA involved in peptidoglycan recycling